MRERAGYSGRLRSTCEKATDAYEVANCFAGHTHSAKLSGALGKHSVQKGVDMAGVKSENSHEPAELGLR